MTPYEEFVMRKVAEYGEKFNTSELSPKFARYLHTGQRIKVRSEFGYERTGTVGVTTGWRPAFLLMHRSNASGSSDVLRASDEIVAVKRGRNYVAV